MASGYRILVLEISVFFFLIGAEQLVLQQNFRKLKERIIASVPNGLTGLLTSTPVCLNRDDPGIVPLMVKRRLLVSFAGSFVPEFIISLNGGCTAG